ncbi:hypothetical protein BDZ89DRAFT_1060878 [Hymenopellis radicata]|nr:hypothetical protein BDZ89DRAFT_1060878 [Hymenopellis radicata]
MGSVARLPAMSPPPPPSPSARPGSSTSATVSEPVEHDDEQDPGEVESITPWPTSPVAAQIPVSPTVLSNGMPTLDPPKTHVWVNTMDGKSRPVGVSADANYEPPKPLGIRDAILIRRDMEAAFKYKEDNKDDKNKDKDGKESSPDTSTTPANNIKSTKGQLTPSMEAMDINDKRVDSDKDEPESEEDMVVDHHPPTNSTTKPTFSLSPSVDWKRGTKTSSEESGPITPQDAPSFTPSYLEKQRLPAPRQSSQDTGSDYSTTPAPSYRVIRGPGSSSVSAPIFKPPPRRSKPEPEPSLSRSGPSRRAAARARIATQKAQLESEEEEEEEEYWDDDGEDEVDELKSSPPAKKTKVSLGKDDGAYDLDSDDDVPGPLVNVPRKRGRPPNSSLVGGKRRKTGDRYPCSVAGCTKTFTRRNDVERHIKSSGAHPEIKIVDESKRCKHCGTDLSRADARLRHERTNACGKRNLQHSRNRKEAEMAAEASSATPAKARVLKSS